MARPLGVQRLSERPCPAGSSVADDSEHAFARASSGVRISGAIAQHKADTAGDLAGSTAHMYRFLLQNLANFSEQKGYI